MDDPKTAKRTRFENGPVRSDRLVVPPPLIDHAFFDVRNPDITAVVDRLLRQNRGRIVNTVSLTIKCSYVPSPDDDRALDRLFAELNNLKTLVLLTGPFLSNHWWEKILMVLPRLERLDLGPFSKCADPMDPELVRRVAQALRGARGLGRITIGGAFIDDRTAPIADAIADPDRRWRELSLGVSAGSTAWKRYRPRAVSVRLIFDPFCDRGSVDWAWFRSKEACETNLVLDGFLRPDALPSVGTIETDRVTDRCLSLNFRWFREYGFPRPFDEEYTAQVRWFSSLFAEVCIVFTLQSDPTRYPDIDPTDEFHLISQWIRSLRIDDPPRPTTYKILAPHLCGDATYPKLPFLTAAVSWSLAMLIKPVLLRHESPVTSANHIRFVFELPRISVAQSDVLVGAMRNVQMPSQRQFKLRVMSPYTVQHAAFIKHDAI